MSTPFNLTYGVGNITPAWSDWVWPPRTIRGATKYGVVLLHGASSTSDWDIVGVGWPSMNKLASVLAAEGIPCVAGGMLGNNFGVDAITGPAGDINDAIAYMAAQTGCSAAKAHVFGLSMGGGVGLRWAALNPTKAASVSGLLPAVSTEHPYTDNPNALLNAAAFSAVIAGALGLAYRSVADGVTNGTTTLTSATANFQDPGDVGKQITRSYNATGGIPTDTVIQSVTNSTTVIMDKAATASATGLALGFGAPLPMSGDAGYDLIGHFAPVLAANNIPNRWYFASDDPYVYASDVNAAAAAAGGTAINLGTGGHTNVTGNHMDTYNGGSDFSDFVAWLKANGA